MVCFAGYPLTPYPLANSALRDVARFVYYQTVVVLFLVLCKEKTSVSFFRDTDLSTSFSVSGLLSEDISTGPLVLSVL